MKTLNKEYWNNRYINDNNPWNIGFASPSIVEYLEQLEDKSIKILIPGCGNAHEAKAAFDLGFKNVFLLDWSDEVLKSAKDLIPELGKEYFIQGDFFEHEGEYDLIIEQTFFCAINPELRSKYVQKCSELLSKNGKIIGLLFATMMNKDKPPFGGNKDIYRPIFDPFFDIKTLEKCHNSIPPRLGNELFINFKKK